MELNECRVFVCVPAVGKSHLASQNDNFIDMDEMKARYKYAQETNSEKEIEWLKGNRGKAVRTDTLQYIENKTKEYLASTDKILLFAPNKEIVEMICRNNIPYCLVFHDKDCIKEIEERMRKRGNQENFIRAMIDPIDEFYQASISDTRPSLKIELHAGEYLADIFKDPQRFSSRIVIPEDKEI